MFIAHSAAKQIAVDAPKKMELAMAHGRHEVMLVTGGTGSGKTTLTQHIAEQARRLHGRDDAEKTIEPAIILSAPDPCTPRELCVQLLTNLGDPSPRKRERGDLPKVTATLMRQCGVRVVLFDNFQDVPAKRASRGIEQVLVRLRELMDQTDCLWVLLGTKEARMVIRSDLQITRRCPYEAELEYFSVKTEAKRRAFVEVLAQLDRWLPLAERTDIGAWAANIFIATEGIFDRIVRLLDAAWPQALNGGRERLVRQDFIDAFNFIHGSRPEINPFVEGFVHRNLNQRNEPYELLRASA